MSPIQKYIESHGFPAFSPKAVLFDMDGVLYDSMPNHAIAWQRSMEECGLLMTAHDAYATEGARGIDTIRQMVLEQQGRNITLDEAQRMYDLKTRYFHERPEPPVMPGVRRLMSQAAADGLTICVVTGSGQRPLINRLMRDFGDYLTDDCIVTAYDVTRGKPAPDPYLMGLQKAGRAVRLHTTPDNNPTAQASKPEDCALKPWEAVVVENAPLGVRAGVAANIFTVAVNTGPLPDSILLDAGADLLFSSMTDFADAWKDLKTFVTD